MKLDLLENKINYKFNNKSLLRGALTHPSYDLSLKGAEKRRFYQRLEFMGDAVLSSAIVDMLYHSYPDSSEGELALFHTNLVKSSSIVKVAQNINLFEHIIFGKSDLKYSEISFLENSMESLLGAIYIDGGYDLLRNRVIKLWNNLILSSDFFSKKSAKSELQEYLQKKGMSIPQYQLLNTTGTDHNPIFTIIVIGGGKESSGQGKSKKIAEENAAINLLNKFKEDKSAS
ncbi:ribonuclease III [Lyticum sinuosum]|uniref:Ribonuclease 3 n=1 Tax=Lyticum sinuosum TaxID=1332059 RepID=A0AAE4VKY8_9RICK|nr:ribonuclease III [Lyticum sinuosum]MDZ5761234.1 Ribonuclease 3 [Lyticum sinuosum]